MDLQSGRSRAGSLVAGGYDEFFTPVDDCMAVSRPQAGPAPRGGRMRGDAAGGAERSRSRSRSKERRRVSLQQKTSQHGADIRRQQSRLGSAVNMAGSGRVRSSVSGFVNRDYHTPNDSVPVIQVSENYSRVFVHTSDEDTDSGVEEVTEKKYSTESKTLRDAVKTNFNVRKAATGIPRMEGHMRLPDRKSAPKEPKDPRLYLGNSYLVEIPERLERSTRALTCTAVTKVMEGERSRRVADIRTRGAPVSDPWLMVQQELRQMANLAEQEENEISIAASQNTESSMELVREQMMQEVHRKKLRGEEEEAKEFKQMFFKGVAKNKLPQETMEVVTSTSEHLGSVLQELVEAFTCSEMDEEIRIEAVVERSQDLKDTCLTELMRCVISHKINIEITIEQEQRVQESRRGKPAAARRSSSTEGQPTQAAAKNQVGGTIEKIFKRVETRELKKEDRAVDKVSEFKCICQEELVHKVWRRKVSVACSHEKARRIIEADDPTVMDDPKRLQVSDAWVRVQAQMIIDMFKGKQPTKKSSVTEVLYSGDNAPTKVYTALDRRLRAIRERFRRPALYFCDEDDEYSRERARRKHRLSPSPGDLGSGASVASSRSSRRRSSRARSQSRSSRSSSQRASRTDSRAGSRRSSRSGGSPPAAARSQGRQSPKSSRSPDQPASAKPSGQSFVTRIPLVRSSLRTSVEPAVRSTSRYGVSRAEAKRQASATGSSGRQSTQTARSQSRQSTATARSPSRQSAATAKSVSRQASSARGAGRQSAALASPSASRPSSSSRGPSPRQPAAASRSPGRKSTAAPSAGITRSRSFVSARSTSPVTARDVSPPSILKKSTEASSRRASSQGPSAAAQQQRRRPASSRQASAVSQQSSRRSVSARGSVGGGSRADSRASAPPQTTPRQSSSRASRQSGGDFKELVAPRRMHSDVAQSSAAARSYRRRGDKTDDFRRERAAIASQRDHERNEKAERKRNRRSPQATDQFRSHWTAHVE